MTCLPLIIAPHPIFRQKAVAVEQVTDETRALIAAMFDTLHREQGAGLGANMVGLLERIIVVDFKDPKPGARLAMINPEITKVSDELQTFEEASLSFPGIRAPITRPRAICVTYLDEGGAAQTLEAEDYLATVIQHEIDYLDGRTFVDHLSPVKRRMLIKKMIKIKNQSDRD